MPEGHGAEIHTQHLSLQVAPAWVFFYIWLVSTGAIVHDRELLRFSVDNLWRIIDLFGVCSVGSMGLWGIEWYVKGKKW
jgi:hypothetical protein